MVERLVGDHRLGSSLFRTTFGWQGAVDTAAAWRTAGAEAAGRRR